MLKSIVSLFAFHQLVLSQNWVAIPGFDPNGGNYLQPTRPRLTQRPTAVTQNPTLTPTNRPTDPPVITPSPTLTIITPAPITALPIATQPVVVVNPVPTNPATSKPVRPMVSIPMITIPKVVSPNPSSGSTTSTTTTSTTTTSAPAPIAVVNTPTAPTSLRASVKPPSLTTIYKGGVGIPGLGHNGGPPPTAPQSVTSAPIVDLPAISFKPIHIPGMPVAMIPNVPGGSSNRPFNTVPPAPTLPPVDALVYPAGDLYSLYSGARCGRGPSLFCAGHSLQTVDAFVDNGFKDAMVIVVDPLRDFKLTCSQKSSCENAVIELRYAYEGTCGQTFDISDISCSGINGCANMQLTIDVQGPMGCNKVMIANVGCNEIGSCTKAQFKFLGEVETVHCDLGPSGHSAFGLDACYNGLSSFICADVRACAGVTRTLSNPSSSFVLECGSLDSCKGMDLTLYLDASGWWDPVTMNQVVDHVSTLSGFKFSGEGSAANAKITIANNQQGKSLEIEKVECTALNSCNRTIFNLGENTKIKEFHCFANTCNGCIVKEGWSDYGKPCAEYAPV